MGRREQKVTKNINRWKKKAQNEKAKMKEIRKISLGVPAEEYRGSASNLFLGKRK